jgi:LysR family transcriptional regulator, glycine cleavage system transcriptional activator
MELPPVTLLRAFDAAGRHGSFKAAADFLSVTPSTISHQIADLEQYLGVALFHRNARGLTLTAEGAALLTDVADAFERLRSATARLRVQGQPVSVRISANPFFASEILIPLIQSFDATFPGVAIHISATEQLEDPRDGAIDFCVRFGSSEWPGLESHFLYPVLAVPMIGINADKNNPARIDFNYSGGSAWQLWAQRGGEVVNTNSATRMFNSYSAAMRAMAQGLGVCIAMMPVTQPWIDQGLVQSYENHKPIALGNLYLVSRPLTPAQTRLRDIRDWLVSQFCRSTALE